MSQNWLDSYQSLTVFIKDHPEVAISPSSVAIPGEVRPEFYRLFDATRAAVIEETIPDKLAQAQALSNSYLAVEARVKEQLHLEEIILANPLGWFLRNPLDGLMRELFDPLFNLLKGRLTIESFTDKYTTTLRHAFFTLYGQGYAKWLSLSLITVLDSDQVFNVVLRRPGEHREWTIIRAHNSAEPAPEPQEAKVISFAHLPEHLFNVPDFIVHSLRLGKYVAVRDGLNTALATGLRPSDKREWRPQEAIIYSESNPVILLVSDTLDDVNLISDAKNTCRPDVLIQGSPLTERWLENKEEAMSWQETLAPLGETFIVGAAPEAAAAELGANLKFLEVGLEAKKLEPVVEALARAGQKDSAEPKAQVTDISQA